MEGWQLVIAKKAIVTEEDLKRSEEKSELVSVEVQIVRHIVKRIDVKTWKLQATG